MRYTASSCAMVGDVDGPTARMKLRRGKEHHADSSGVEEVGVMTFDCIHTLLQSAYPFIQAATLPPPTRAANLSPVLPIGK